MDAKAENRTQSSSSNSPSRSGVVWRLRRLMAMGPAEVLWRVGQWRSLRRERKQFCDTSRPRTPLTAGLAMSGLAPRDLDAPLDPMSLGLRLDDPPACSPVVPEPVEDYDGHWPLLPSSVLRPRGGDDSRGDIRQAWEPHRHHRLARLAWRWWTARQPRTLQEIHRLLDAYDAQAPLMWGIGWMSPMEVAIRLVNWLTALAMLTHGGATASDPALCRRLRTGALNMAAWIARHRSRYSSANNHLLVEMAALGMAGHLLGRRDWADTAAAVMDAELLKQNSRDGVNRESSLHYHAMVMEAYMLLMGARRASGQEVPRRWTIMIGRMAAFLAQSTHGCAPGTALEYGDDDDGRLLGLASADPADYYEYVLQAASAWTGQRHAAFSRGMDPAAQWLVGADALRSVLAAEPVDLGRGHTWEEGGYTVLRNGDGRMAAAMDHAPHGFGAIAAHAHDDALAVLLSVDSRPVLADTGTSAYNVDPAERDRVRLSRAHNTVTLDGHSPSQPLGAFLWGRRASTVLDDHGAGWARATTVDSRGRASHTRTLRMAPDGLSLTVTDALAGHFAAWESRWLVPGTQAPAVLPDGRILLAPGVAMALPAGTSATVEDAVYYPRYAHPSPAHAVIVTGAGREDTSNLTYTISLK